jgi:hypothetical protein
MRLRPPQSSGINNAIAALINVKPTNKVDILKIDCQGLRKGCRCLVNKIVFDGDAIYAHAELMYLVVLCSRSF